MSDDSEPTYDYWTMVLVGRTGNGKSATGNSILGRNAFKFKRSSSRVTTACQLERTVKDDQIISVIDTPGLFDFTSGSELMKECLWLAKDGIHAILVVFSVRNRFSQEEEAAVRSLRSFFGSKIMDYMIVVFTGGDELKSNGETLDDYLGGDCPQPLKDLLTACHNRCVLFDNVTRSETQRTKQRRELLSVVNTVFTQNNRCPYNTVEVLIELQVEAKLKGAKKEIESLSRQLDELRNRPTGGGCTIL